MAITFGEMLPGSYEVKCPTCPFRRLVIRNQAGIKARKTRIGGAMDCRRRILELTGAALFVPFIAFAQQQPIYGCRTALSCRPSPIGNSALADKTLSGLLVTGGVGWGPGFHFGMPIPSLQVPAPQPTAVVDARVFRLRDVRLLPSPGPAITPAPTPTPAPAANTRSR